MKFEVKTEPVCTVLVVVPAYFAIVVITLGTGVQAQDFWFLITVVVTILAIAISFVYSKYSKYEGRRKRRAQHQKLTDEGDAGHNNRRGGFRHGGRRNNNAAGGGGSSGNTPNDKCPTGNKDLPENLVFDNTGHNDAANFHRTLKGLANFMHTTYSAEVASVI